MKTKKTHMTPTAAERRALDPKSINQRLYDQVDVLLKQLERGGDEIVTLKERIAALIAIGRVQIMFVGLRKEKFDDDAGRAGSAVRKYAGAFAADDARRRTQRARADAADDSAGLGGNGEGGHPYGDDEDDGADPDLTV